MARALDLKLRLARAVGGLSRRRGGGATSAPGRVLLRLQPDAIPLLAGRLGDGSVLISATNGKTTTASMAAAILRRRGVELVHNRAGANMAGGVASALLAAAGSGQTMAGELGLFEVDELWVERLARELRPRAILLANLFRDQLDRYGELDRIADSWERVLDSRHTRLVLNADDPLLADLGREHEGVTYFGIEDDSLALAGMVHAADAKHCRNCGSAYVFDTVYMGHLGRYRCPGCARARPAPAVSASAVQLEGVRASRFMLHAGAEEAEVALALPGLYNVYNALAAAALAVTLEVPLAMIVAGLSDVRPAFGRGERVTLSADRHAGVARELRIMLVKNPAGANEVLRTLMLEPGEHDVLGVLNDLTADGHDVSWIWDADFELLAGRVRRVTCSGTRAADLAVRLKYAGIDPQRIRLQGDLDIALGQAAADRSGSESPLYALPTYTAMLALRKLLVDRGEASSAWS